MWLVQVWNEGSSEDEVLVMVVRTGLCTTMGTMLRQVTKPPNRFQIHKDPFLKVSTSLSEYMSYSLPLLTYAFTCLLARIKSQLGTYGCNHMCEDKCAHTVAMMGCLGNCKNCCPLCLHAQDNAESISET